MALLAFGAIVLALLDEEAPDRSRLTQVTGQLRSLEKATSKGGGLSAVRFSLSTDPRNFHYISRRGKSITFGAPSASGTLRGWCADRSCRSSLAAIGRSCFLHSVRSQSRGRNGPTLRASRRVLGRRQFHWGRLGYGSAVTGIALLFIHLLGGGSMPNTRFECDASPASFACRLRALGLADRV